MSSASGHDYFLPGSVVWDLHSTNKFDAIRETIHRTEIFRTIPGLNLDSLTAAVIRREKEQSTGFGHGIAIAHGRTPLVPTSAIALGVSRDGLDFDAFDGLPVNLLFIVASHPNRQIDYLRILSSLAIMARNELFRRELLSCICQEEAQAKVCDAFSDVLTRSLSIRAS